jgi:hypothetical protein
MKQRTGFRAWFYFRMGWGTYFAFIFAAINTLTVTYFLAIEKAPILQEIFPSFLIYILFTTMIGVPLLILVGYIHFRRTAAYGSEAEVQVESNPYYYKLAPGWQKDVMFPVLNKLIDVMVKNNSNEKLTKEDLTEIIELQRKMDILLKGEMVGSPRKLKTKIKDTKT